LFDWSRPELVLAPVRKEKDYKGLAAFPCTERVQQGWIEDGRRVQRAIGLATLRRDGFVSLRSGNTRGTLVTRVLRNSGSRLEVNADIQGDLTVEIQEPTGAPIQGFRGC